MDLPATAQRVALRTPAHVNRKIERMIERSVAYYRGNQDEIPERLKQLDREWDIERAIEANASSLMLVGLGLGLGVDRKFLALPLVVSAFLLQHALQGWCPPVTVFRRLGIRTQGEIEEERRRLLAIQRYTAH